MTRPLLWAVLGIALSLLVVPTEALADVAPMLLVVAIGLGVVVIAGIRGQRAERNPPSSDRADHPAESTEMEQ